MYFFISEQHYWFSIRNKIVFGMVNFRGFEWYVIGCIKVCRCDDAACGRWHSDIMVLYTVHSVKREGVGAAKMENDSILEMSATDNVLTRRGGQSVCKQSWEYAWAGCSNPGNRWSGWGLSCLLLTHPPNTVAVRKPGPARETVSACQHAR